MIYKYEKCIVKNDTISNYGTLQLTSLDEELKLATGEMNTVQNNYAKLRKEFLDEQRHVDNKLRELSSPSSSYGMYSLFC
jgi:hypothetical protein